MSKVDSNTKKKMAEPINKKKIQNDLLLNSLFKFYSKKKNIKVISEIINGNSKISLRLIDWFVTNYCKKNNIFITKTANKTTEHVNVYTDYRAQLKAYSKHLFDPFRRRERINFYYDDNSNDFIHTTTAQLVFMKWAIENNILLYIEEHMKEIENDMIKSQKENQVKKNDKNNIKTTIKETDDGKVVVTRKKRNELSKNKSKNITYNHGKRLISFD